MFQDRVSNSEGVGFSIYLVFGFGGFVVVVLLRGLHVFGCLKLSCHALMVRPLGFSLCVVVVFLRFCVCI